MLLTFNYGPQSGWQRGAGGTNCFLRDGGPLLHQFCLKSLHSWLGRGAGLGLQDWPDREVQRVKIKAPCRSDFLTYEWGDFLLNPGLGDLGSVRGRSVLLQEPENSLQVLLGPGQHATFQNVGDVALGVQFDSREHKKQWWLSGLSQSEIIADVMHNYRRISEIMHGYRRKFGDNNYSRRS